MTSPASAFDPLAIPKAADRQAFFRAARAGRPRVLRSDRTRCIHFFRHDHVREALLDTYGLGAMPLAGPLDSLLNIDPPAHGRIRKVVRDALALKAIGPLERRARAVAEICLDEVVDRAEVDLVRSFTWRFPELFLVQWMGLEPEDHHTLSSWTDRFMKPADRAEHLIGSSSIDLAAAFDEVRAFFEPRLRARRGEPKPDLLSVIALGSQDGSLSESEAVALAFLFCLAGQDAASASLSSVVVELSRRSRLSGDLRRLLPRLPDSAIDELLRFVSPFRYAERFVAHPCRIGGVDLVRGDVVLAWIESANHDEEVFERPEDIDLVRQPNPHLALGLGIHLCIGGHLGRLLLRVGLEALLSRTRRIDLPQPAEPLDAVLLSGFERVPALLRSAS